MAGSGWIREKGAAADAPQGGRPIADIFLDDNTPAAVTQETNKTTAVVINAYAGVITTLDVALAAAGEFEFSVTNSKVQAGDIVVACVGSGPADNEHVAVFVSSVTNGAFTLAFTNLAAANQADGAMTVNFIVLKPAMRRLVFRE